MFFYYVMYADLMPCILVFIFITGTIFKVFLIFTPVGKSTIASLLENFYDLDSGVITIDGYDVKELDKSWLRGDLIGFINQVCKVIMFNPYFIISKQINAEIKSGQSSFRFVFR